MTFERKGSRLRHSAISISALALSLALSTPAMAQTDTSTLEGHVDGGAAGTAVVVTDKVTGQQSTATLDADGNYILLGLRPSTYTVAVEGKTSQETTLLIGQTGVVDFLDAAPTAEGKGIVVTGRRLREVRTPTVSTNITPAQIENLPQNQRNFLSFAALAPGVQVAPGGTAQIQAGATSASNVNVLLDGMSLKNPINHGGVFGQNFGIGNPFPQIAIQEYKVETQNFGAETGQAGSAVLTAITKSGGNEFHGSAFIEWQPKAFIGQPYFDKKNGVKKPDYDRKQFGGELGGPIIPGKLHFYVAGEGTIQSLPATSGSLGANNNYLPDSISSQILIPHNKDFKQGLYFGKLTWFATPDDTINLSAFVRRENNLSDIDSNAASSHGRTILTHQNRYQLQWLHNAGDFLNAINISLDKGEQSTPSVGTGPEYVVSNNFATTAQCSIFPVSADPGSQYQQCLNQAGNATFSTAAQLGAHFFNQGDKQRILTIRDDATWRKGEHTIKAGVQVAFMALSREVNDHFNGSYYYYNPGPTGTLDLNSPYGAKINIAPSPDLSAKNTQVGLYVQDEWKPDDHWTFNLGLRWDFETNANNNKYVTPADIAAALRAYPGWAARGLDAEDYISDGNNRKPVWDMFQPRLGFSYDVKGDRDLVIFGGAGRYYDRSLFIAGAIEKIGNSNKVVTYDFAGACLGAVKPAYCSDPDALRTFLQSQNIRFGSVNVLNNKLKMPYADQFDLGIRKRFGQIQTSITLSHIRSHNIFQFVRANFFTNGWYTRYLQRDGSGNVIGCTDGGDAWIKDNPVTGSYAGCAAGSDDFGGRLDRGASDGKARYTAIYLQAEKPFTDNSIWGFTTALTLQRARSDDAMELNNDGFFNGARQNAYGWNNVNGVEKWRWITSANYRAPWGIVLSGQLSLTSGPAFGNIRAPWNSSVVAPDGACCYGNFGGALWPKKFIGYKRLDLRLAKEFKTPWGHEMTVDFEVFNVFNWLNRSYATWDAGGGDPAPRTWDSQVGNDSRSFQAGLKYSF